MLSKMYVSEFERRLNEFENIEFGAGVNCVMWFGEEGTKQLRKNPYASARTVGWRIQISRNR